MKVFRNDPPAGTAPAADGPAAQGKLQGGHEAPGSHAPEGTGAQADRAFTQAEVDALVEQRLADARREADARLEAARAEGRAEAERLSRMTAEERLRHDREAAAEAARRRSAALDAREAEIARRELRAEAAGRLAERELPRELGELLDYSSADAMSDSIGRLEQIYRAAVQQGIDARLRASGLRVRTGGGRADAADPSGMDDAAYYASLRQ